MQEGGPKATQGPFRAYDTNIEDIRKGTEVFAVCGELLKPEYVGFVLPDFHARRKEGIQYTTWCSWLSRALREPLMGSSLSWKSVRGATLSTEEASDKRVPVSGGLQEDRAELRAEATGLHAVDVQSGGGGDVTVVTKDRTFAQHLFCPACRRKSRSAAAVVGIEEEFKEIRQDRASLSRDSDLRE